MKSFLKLFGAICAWVLFEACCLAYDPLSVANPNAVRIQDFTVQDKVRNRGIPIRVYCPVDKAPAPVVLFSHGLGGSREGSVFLGKHWAGRGYMAVFMQHPGSDTSVWQGKPSPCYSGFEHGFLGCVVARGRGGEALAGGCRPGIGA